MFELAAPVSFESTIKKSLFIAHAAPVESVQAAMAFFEQHHQPDATHNCWAFKLVQAYRFNDDGEPGGTAGRPILQAIEGKQLQQVAVLVIRYFGGIKLGTGGLVRAYGGVAAQCLQQGVLMPVIACDTVHCQAEFAQMALLKSRLLVPGVQLLQESFTETGVAWTLSIPRAQTATLATIYQNLTRGKGHWHIENDY